MSIYIKPAAIAVILNALLFLGSTLKTAEPSDVIFQIGTPDACSAEFLNKPDWKAFADKVPDKSKPVSFLHFTVGKDEDGVTFSKRTTGSVCGTSRPTTAKTVRNDSFPAGRTFARWFVTESCPSTPTQTPRTTPTNSTDYTLSLSGIRKNRIIELGVRSEEWGVDASAAQWLSASSSVHGFDGLNGFSRIINERR